MSHHLSVDSKAELAAAVPGREFAEIDDAALAAYRRDGFLVLRGVVRGAELEALRVATDRVTAEAIKYGRELDARTRVRLEIDHGFYEWDGLDERQFLYARDTQGGRGGGELSRCGHATWPSEPSPPIPAFSPRQSAWPV